MAYELTDVERKAWSRLAGNRTFPEGLEFADDAGRRLDQLALCKVAVEGGLPAKAIEQSHLDDEDGPEALIRRVAAYKAGRI